MKYLLKLIAGAWNSFNCTIAVASQTYSPQWCPLEVHSFKSCADTLCVCFCLSITVLTQARAACRRATSSRVVVAFYTMRERSVVKSRLRSAAVQLRHRRPERASAVLRALGRIMQIDTGYYVIIWEHVNWQLSFFASHSRCQAFSKRKLSNGENFRIKYFYEFRCFWSSWVRIVGFKKIYVCMYICMCVSLYIYVKPNFVPVITLERMHRLVNIFACACEDGMCV